MGNIPGIPLIRDQMEIDAPTTINATGKELAVSQTGAKELQDQQKTPITTMTKLSLETSVT
jgi:hypothetical protein